MCAMDWNLFVLTLLLGIHSHVFCVHAVVVYETNGCSSDHGGYTQGSEYQHNLNTLFSNLSSKTSSWRFYNSTSGEYPDKVYGIYQCRDDLSQDICNDCIKDATKKITQVCPFYGEGIVWYEECMLRYANRSIFSLSETSSREDDWYTDSVSNIDKFVPVVEKTMKTITSQAVRARGHFASTYADFTLIDRMYCFAMCTPDLNEIDCNKCLTIALAQISTFYNTSKGVTSFYPSCQVGYDTELRQMTHVPLDPNQAPAPPQTPALVVDYEYTVCSSDHGYYTKGSVYQQNLYRLLTSLLSQNSSRRFYNSTTGDFPNKIYGIYQCREDFSLEICHKCVKEAAEKITQLCPLYRESIVWYDECMLRYANRFIFSLPETYPSRESWYQDSVTNYDKFGPVVERTMNHIINQAAHNTARGHFANTFVDWTMINKMFCFAQCTPDIDEFDCKNCLTIGLAEISGFYNISAGMTVFYPSCQLGFDTKLDKMRNIPQSLDANQAQTLPPIPERQKRSSRYIVAVSVPTVLAALLFSSACACIYCYKRNKTFPDLEEMVGDESIQYDFKTIRDATDNFSPPNKLGQGGFGGVYKGRLQNGQEIAVKRLDMYSGQGFKEFKTEVLLVVKLQHKNLVRLLGFSIAKGEKLLVYEFLQNSSLDKFLFDPLKRALLDWETRYKIIAGIARGLMYLHEDSRLTIVHRDLKCSNILLDEDMNPKIADFGIARLFGADQIHASTKIIVGTYGYMAPEYAMHGHFSVKSDVYSFGMIVLELISGQRSTFYNPSSEQGKTLLHRAWTCWYDNQPLSLVDKSFNGNFSVEEVIKCIHIGMLCIQEEASRRPIMSMVVNVINGTSSINLPEPVPPLMAQPIGLQIVTSISESSEIAQNNLCKFSGIEDSPPTSITASIYTL